MLGLAVGTICYLKLPLLKRNPLGSLVNIEFALVLYFLFMIVIALTQPPQVSIIIPFMVFVGGLMGGMHFPVSIAIISRQKAGFVYGVDLFGSSIGALVTAVILLPILGIVFTLAVFSLLNCLVGIGLITIRNA
jgi:predicted membrane-bound spermidine synthase